MYPEKIKAWLSRSLDALAVTVEEEGEDKPPQQTRFIKMRKQPVTAIKTSKRIQRSSLSSVSSEEEDADTDYDNEEDDDESVTMSRSHYRRNHENSSTKNIQDNSLSERLRNALLQTDSQLYPNVSWDTTKSDMFIEADGNLFPVEKNFIVYISEKFHTLIYSSSSIQVGDSVFLTLNQYSVNEIQTVLTYMHSSDDAKLTGMYVYHFRVFINNSLVRSVLMSYYE